VNRQNIALERRQPMAKRVVRTNDIMWQLNSFLHVTKYKNSKPETGLHQLNAPQPKNPKHNPK
jgi:hypothetical protein